MNILVTGATSFIGVETVKALLSEDNKVYALVRPESIFRDRLPNNNNLIIINENMNNIAALDKYNLEMDVCINLAWSGVGVNGRMNSEIQAANIQNTINLLEYVGTRGCRSFIFSGSQAEYGVTKEKIDSGQIIEAAINESLQCDPISEYGKAKLAFGRRAIELAMKKGIHYCHLRIFSVYGPNDHETSLVSTCIRHAKNHTVARLGRCDQKWNFLHVRDCAKAIAVIANHSLMDQRQNTIYNIGSTDTRILSEFVKDIFETAGFKNGYLLEEREISPEGTPYLIPDISKLMNECDWYPNITFNTGIQELLQND